MTLSTVPSMSLQSERVFDIHHRRQQPSIECALSIKEYAKELFKYTQTMCDSLAQEPPPTINLRKRSSASSVSDH